MHHFSRSHASTFTNRFVHISDRNDAAPMHVHCHDVSWRFSNYCDNCYLASDVKCRCPRAQKLQLCTNFRGRTDRHLRGVSVLIRDQMAVLLRLCDATLCHQGTPRTALTICLPPIKKSWDFVLKRFNYAPFSRSHGSSFARRVGHYSRPNGVSTTSVRRHNVPWMFCKGRVNSFLASSVSFMSPRAQKVQLCTIFRRRTDRHLRGVLVIIRDQVAVQLR